MLLLLLVALPSQAQIGISPQKYDLEFDGQTRTHTFRLFNFSDEPRELEVTINNWRMNNSNRVEVIPPTEQSLDQWVIMNPLRFTLPPRESQAVRFAIRPAVQLAHGEHRAMIYFTEKLPPDDDPDKPTVRSRMRIGAAVYLQVGPVQRRGTIDAVEMAAQASQVNITMTNTGSANTRLSGTYQLLPTGTDPSEPKRGNLPQIAVLPGDTRVIPVPLEDGPLSPGQYQFSVAGRLGEQVIERSWPINVP